MVLSQLSMLLTRVLHGMRSAGASFWAILKLGGRRLVAQRNLVLVAGIGLVAAAALTLSISIYADATQFRLLRERLNQGKGAVWEAPLPLMIEYNATSRNRPTWSDMLPLDDYLTFGAAADLHLAPLQIVRQFHTDAFELYPPYDDTNPTTRFLLSYNYLGTLSSLKETFIVIDGKLPEQSDPGEPIQALANQQLVEDFGLQPGDKYLLRRSNLQDIPILIAGIWQATEPDAPYWDVSKSPLLIIPEEVYINQIAPLIDDELYDCVWYLELDGSPIHAGDIAELINRYAIVSSEVGRLFEKTKQTITPVEELEQYQTDAPALTFLLYAFSIPIMGLVLVFIGLVASVYINEKRNEIAILRSRGGSAGLMAGTASVEGLLLGTFALILGIPTGAAIAYAIGRARSFLDFSAPPALRVSLTVGMLAFSVLATVIILLAGFVLPTLSAARFTIVTYRQDRARQTETPFWQRIYLDLLLLIIAAYGAYDLSMQANQVAEGAVIPDPLQNPMLLLIPALGIFALTLLMLRVIPKLIASVAWALERSKSVGMLMAARYLSRSPAAFNAPLILLILTLSLSAFTASLAQTIDQHLTRQSYYSVGADLAIHEIGFPDVSSGEIKYFFGPVEEHLAVPGVNNATRVGRYPATVLLAGGKQSSGTFLGVDYQTFSQVAFWEKSFARSPLTTLLNELAANPGSLIVSRELLENEGLQIGDTLLISVSQGGQSLVQEMRIVDSVDFFPTWYPETGPLFVGNLEDLFLSFGRELPHDVYLSLKPGTNPEDVVYAVRGFSILLDLNADQSRLVRDGLNIQVDGWKSSHLLITNEQARPERQGLFGLLSVGFITSALLTVLGFLLYAAFSFRRRFIELGMLRAIGLSALQLTTLLSAELIFLIGVGMAAGTALGVSISFGFVPYLQLGTSLEAHYPPFQVVIAWASIFQIYMLFGILFLLGTAALSTLLLRMKIFQAVKLGETT